MNRILERQLKRLNLEEGAEPDSLEKWENFLKVISETYEQHAYDRYLIERSLEISSIEMTERLQKNKELSIQLIQASKLASLGTLASGVAHELNNPLQAIKGYVEILMTDVLDKETIANHLERILRLSDRMASTIKNLLRLSRKSQDIQKTKLLITDPINEVYELLGKQFIFDQIQFEMNIKCKDPYIMGEINQLFGVFQNLFSNSRDAFLSLKERSSSKILVTIDEVGEEILLLFQDNAGGIPSDVLPRIFDPFFTTKDVGKGTGLGLAISKQTIEELGGVMKVQVNGPQTTFMITFPKAKS